MSTFNNDGSINRNAYGIGFIELYLSTNNDTSILEKLDVRLGNLNFMPYMPSEYWEEIVLGIMPYTDSENNNGFEIETENYNVYYFPDNLDKCCMYEKLSSALHLPENWKEITTHCND